MNRVVQNLRDAGVPVQKYQRPAFRLYATAPSFLDRSPGAPGMRRQPRRLWYRRRGGAFFGRPHGAVFPVHRVFLQASCANVLASNRPHRLTVKLSAPHSGDESTHVLFRASVTSRAGASPRVDYGPKRGSGVRAAFA